MGNAILYLLLLSSPSLITSASHKLQPQQPPRPTRTLGSLFGSSKPVPPQQPPPPQQQPQPSEQQKSINSVHLGGGVGSGVRPLVYQVKYYDRIQNNLIDYPSDPRNYNPIDKAGVVLGDQPQVVTGQGVQQQPSVYYGQPPIIPPRYYYNPLIPQQQPYQPVQDPVVYTIANIGNTQVLIPCTTPTQQYDQPFIYDSTIALNVDTQQLQQQSQQTPVRVPQQQQPNQPPAISTVPHPQRSPPPLVPHPGVQQPLVRDQVIAAAQELSSLNALPGSAIVGANINSVPYTQGSYFYYYLIPSPQQQVPVIEQQQQVPVRYPYTPINPYYRQTPSINGVPVVLLNGYGYGQQQQTPQIVQIPQPSNPVPMRSTVPVTTQQQPVQQTQQQQQVQSQQQQQQQQVKG